MVHVSNDPDARSTSASGEVLMAEQHAGSDLNNRFLSRVRADFNDSSQ
jgi:hypothetical protein